MMPRLLIVDDECDLRECIADLLRLHEVTVFTARSGSEALELVQYELFDVVLTDLRMPGMDGLATIRALRGVAPGLRFILMTAFTSDEVAAACRQLDVQMLHKPFPVEELLRALERSA